MGTNEKLKIQSSQFLRKIKNYDIAYIQVNEMHKAQGLLGKPHSLTGSRERFSLQS
jgi:hypothetical protein